MKAQTLFEGARMTLDEAKELSINSLKAYLDDYEHLAVAFSGGKDSSATITFLAYAIKHGLIKNPKSLIVFYADTRLELTPLHHSAMAILDSLKAIGIETEIVLPPLDDRFFVYMLGRGVPPPSNTFRDQLICRNCKLGQVIETELTDEKRELLKAQREHFENWREKQR